MRKLESKTGAKLFAFESMAEINEYVDPKFFRDRGASFTGEELKSWEAVKDKAIGAWEDGMMILTDAVEMLRKEPLPEIKSHKRGFVWRYDEGDEVDLERMAAGEAYWKKYTREESTGPTEVTIITDTTTSSVRNSVDILWRGAVAVALAVLLEEKGYKVELWVVNGSMLYENKRFGVCTACQLKKTSDPLDASTLINVMSGWFYRSSTFALLDTICSKEGERVEEGYGGCYEPRPQDLDELTRDEHRVYSSGVYTYNGALGVIRAEMAKFETKE